MRWAQRVAEALAHAFACVVSDLRAPPQCRPSLDCSLSHMQDDEAELLAELERIKRERAEEAARKATQEAGLAEKEEQARMATGNPLLQEKLAASAANFALKRRWDDDVVFRNQVGLRRRWICWLHGHASFSARTEGVGVLRLVGLPLGAGAWRAQAPEAIHQ